MFYDETQGGSRVDDDKRLTHPNHISEISSKKWHKIGHVGQTQN